MCVCGGGSRPPVSPFRSAHVNLGISVMRLYRPAHEILVLVANAQKPPLNTQNEVSSWSSDLIFDLSLHLYPYFVHQYTRAAKVLASTHICAGSFEY